MTEEEKFTEYVRHYNPDDTKIRLKIIHTWNVVRIADEIAESLDLDEDQKRQVHLAALYHDIGRFEQVRRYHTFMDSKSVPHALLGAEILETGDFLDTVSDQERKQIIQAVRVHSDFQIPDSDTGWQRTLDQILRDADKIDIFRVSYEESPKDTIDSADLNPENLQISKKVEQAIRDGHSVLRSDRKTILDFWISFLGFLFDLNYPRSFDLVDRQQYWNRPLKRWMNEHPQLSEEQKQKLEELLALCQKKIDREARG